MYILTAALATKRRTRRSFPSILTECIRLVKNKCLLGVYIEGLSFTIFFRYLLTILKSEYLSIFTIMVCNLCSFQKTIACHLRIAYVKDIFELGIIQCMVNVIHVNLSFVTTTQKHLSAEILVTSSFLFNNYRNIF